MDANGKERTMERSRGGRYLQRLFGLLIWLGTVPALVWLAAGSPALADGRLERVAAAGSLRVCIWPDYYGISFRNPKSGALEGIDITLSAAFASDLGVALQYVDTAFPRFMEDLLADRCDVAMFGIGMLPERAKRVAFSRPYLRSSIYAITTLTNPGVRGWADIDQPGRVVAVQKGTFMEPAMRESLKAADLLIVAPPATREREVQSGRADVFMTDFPYSRRLLDNADWARLIAPPAPFHPLDYAYAVAPGDADWLARVDRFVAAIKADGRLMEAATRHRLDPIVLRD